MPDDTQETLEEQVEASRSGFAEAIAEDDEPTVDIDDDGDGDGDGDAKPATKPAKTAAPAPAAEDDDADDDAGDKGTPAAAEPPPIDERAKAAEAATAEADYWGKVRQAHSDADTVLDAPWMREFYAQASAEQKARVTQGASADDLVRGLADAKAWHEQAQAAESRRSMPVLESMKDAEITLRDGEKVKIGTLIEQFGEEGKEIVDFIGGVAGLLKSQNEALQARIDALEAQSRDTNGAVTDLRFWSTVREKHADLDTLRATGEIDAFVKAKGPGWVALWNNRKDPQDAADVVAAFKQEKIAQTTDAARQEARGARDKRVKIEKVMLGAEKRRAVPGGGGSESEEDARKAGFLEAINDD